MHDAIVARMFCFYKGGFHSTRGVLKVMLRQFKLHLQMREGALRRLKPACVGRLGARVAAISIAGIT